MGRAARGEDASGGSAAPLAGRRAEVPDAGPGDRRTHNIVPHPRLSGVAVMEVLASGIGEVRKPDPDGFREYVRTHKERRLVNKVGSGQEAISRLGADGDSLASDQNRAV